MWRELEANATNATADANTNANANANSDVNCQCQSVKGNANRQFQLLMRANCANANASANANAKWGSHCPTVHFSSINSKTQNAQPPVACCRSILKTISGRNDIFQTDTHTYFGPHSPFPPLYFYVCVLYSVPATVGVHNF